MASVAKRNWTHKGVKAEAWVVRYLDDKGVRRSKQFDLKRDADAFKRRAERELQDGLHTADTESLTLAQVAPEFLAFTDQRFADGRIGAARHKKLHHMVKVRCLPLMGSKTLNKWEMRDVEKLFRDLIAERGVKAITARETIFDLKLLQDFAIKRGYMKRRPVDEALEELRGIKKARVRVPTEDEVRALIAAAAERPFNCTQRSQRRREVMLHVAAFCGLRQGEILGLKTCHVRFDRGVIEVRHSLLWNDILKGPKTAAGVRDVPMPSHVQSMLAAYIRDFPAASPDNPDGLVFRTQKGKPFDVATLHKQWHDLVERAGIDETTGSLRWHSLRHFCTSWLIRHGMPITDAARLLGHSAFDTTLQIYAHATMSDTVRRDAIQRGAAAFLPTSDATEPQQAITH